MIEMFLIKVLQLAAIVVLFTETCTAHELLQSLEGTVGKENYTYYRLSRTGDIRIELESIEGDADLVVSDETLNPDFEDSKLFSATCGLEIVDIPYTYTRPVGIGIYGHSYYEISKYVIRIYTSTPDVEEDLTYEQLMDKFYKYEPESIERGSRKSFSSSSTSDSGYSSSSDEEDSEGSILWQIIITLLKVVFEVLL